MGKVKRDGAAELEAFAAERTVKKLEDRDLIQALESRGFMITKDERTERQIVLDGPPKGSIRFGVVSDTHLGHKKQQLTYWRDFTEKAKAWGARFMLHGGDVVDGGRMHRDQEFELFKHGADAQATYAAEVFPKLTDAKGKALPTYIIGGNHDASAWNDAGANVLGHLASARKDLHFLGAPAATFHFGPLRIYMMHPDGGPSYARSYRLQKIVEQLAPDDKPHILLAGHWHVSGHVPGYRNVEAFALPCFQAQTAYLKRKGLAPVIGGVLFEAFYDDHGMQDLTTRWVLYRSPAVKDWP